MTAPADLAHAIEGALARAAAELAHLSEDLARVRSLLELIASAAGAK